MLERPERGAVVVKPMMDVGAANALHHVQDPRHLDAAMSPCESCYGDCLIQEYIPGSAQAMRTVTLVHSGTRRLAGAFTAQKLRQWPPMGGVTVFVRSVANQERQHGWITAIAQARAEAAGSWPSMRALLSDPLPIVTRTFGPKRSPRSAPFGDTPLEDDPAWHPAR